MRTERRNPVLRFIGAALGAALMIAALPACENIYEDLQPCPHGVSLRFVYDYNMAYANAFPREVDCLTLLVFDDEDRYVATRTVTGDELRDENYRMTLDLEAGTYRFVAYGGLACGRRSFSMMSVPVRGACFSDLRVRMEADCLSNPDRKRLHGLYWGTLALSTADLYAEGTVRMMKNTNNIRIVLQQENGGTLSPDDFDFEIIDDNTLFGSDNDLLSAGTVTYTPWKTGQAQTGVTIVGDNVVPEAVGVAYAELSTSRLMTKSAPRLVVRRHSDGGAVVDMPLKRYLLMLRSDRYDDMDDQEYLDRECDFVLFFFLRPDGSWIDTRIVVNDWVVRINDAEM